MGFGRRSVLPRVHELTRTPSSLVATAVIGSVSQGLMTVGMQREKSAAASAMRMSDVFFA